MTSRDRVELDLAELREFAISAYHRFDLSPEDAIRATDIQLASDVRGVTTHGLQRLPWYIDHLRTGKYNARPQMAVVRESPASILVDADGAMGQLACAWTMDRMLEKVALSGLCVGATRRSNDWGRGAYYPAQAASRGFVAFGTTTSVPLLAPFGARSRMFGNNPIAFAFPRVDAPPIILDMALTPVALGKVLQAKNGGTPIPEEWGFRDEQGVLTTDATRALAGIIPAIGGYKGIGLSIIMNLLAGALPGGEQTTGVGVGTRGQFFLVVSPELFGDTQSFTQAIEGFVEQFREAELLPGADPTYLPGEIEELSASRMIASGKVAYPRTVVLDLLELANQLELTPPFDVSVLESESRRASEERQ